MAKIARSLSFSSSCERNLFAPLFVHYVISSSELLRIEQRTFTYFVRRLTSCLTVFGSAVLIMFNQQQIFLFGQIQTCQRGGQPYIDTFPYKVSECSLLLASSTGMFSTWLPGSRQVSSSAQNSFIIVVPRKRSLT